MKKQEEKLLDPALEDLKQYCVQKKQEKELKKEIGYYKFNQMKKYGLKSLNELEEYKKRKKEEKKQIKHEKDKIRFKTIRFIERYCNIERKCQICGEKAEIHHPNYKDWLKVNFLCKTHHTALHNFELIPPQVIDLEKISNRKTKYTPR